LESNIKGGWQAAPGKLGKGSITNYIDVTSAGESEVRKENEKQNSSLHPQLS